MTNDIVGSRVCMCVGTWALRSVLLTCLNARGSRYDNGYDGSSGSGSCSGGDDV